MEGTGSDRLNLEDILKNIRELAPEEIERCAVKGSAFREELQEELERTQRIPD